MALKVTVDTSGFDAAKQAIAERCKQAEHVLAEQMEKDTQPFVPMLTGSLTQRTRVVGNDIIYPGPYARFLYYGKVIEEAKDEQTINAMYDDCYRMTSVDFKDFGSETMQHWECGGA